MDTGPGLAFVLLSLCKCHVYKRDIVDELSHLTHLRRRETLSLSLIDVPLTPFLSTYLPHLYRRTSHTFFARQLSPARKMPARVAHKLPCQCDASGREGSEGDRTRSGKRGAAVGDGGCGVRACAGGAAAGPGACLCVRKIQPFSRPKCLQTSKQGRS